jgi:hypothetical protein
VGSPKRKNKKKKPPPGGGAIKPKYTLEIKTHT